MITKRKLAGYSILFGILAVLYGGTVIGSGWKHATLIWGGSIIVSALVLWAAHLISED